MRANEAYSLEYCRRAITSCETLEQLRGAHNLIFNFRRMYDVLPMFNLLEDELYEKRLEIISNMDIAKTKEIENLERQLRVLAELQKDYGHKTLDNIIQGLKARVEEIRRNNGAV